MVPLCRICRADIHQAEGDQRTVVDAPGILERQLMVLFRSLEISAAQQNQSDVRIRNRLAVWHIQFFFKLPASEKMAVPFIEIPCGRVEPADILMHDSLPVSILLACKDLERCTQPFECHPRFIETTVDNPHGIEDHTSL